MPKRKNSRNANGAGTIRKRSDGRWMAEYCTGEYNPKTGKLVRKSIYGKTQKEVKDKLTAALHAISTGTYLEPTQITVSAWLAEWLETFCKNSVKPLTYAAYTGVIRKHINPAFGSVRLQSVRGSHIQKLYNSMIDSGLSAKTVKNTSAVLHKAFSVAVKQRLILSNPVNAAELPRAEKHEIKPLTDAEIPLFLEAITTDTMENAFALCLFAGLREGECLGLSWSQVDFENGCITISQQLQKEKKRGAVYYIANTTKGGTDRTIRPPAIAFEYLRRERSRQLENRLAAGEAWDNEWNLVFTNPLGEHLAFATFYNHFKKIAASIGRPDLRPHDLRHTCATVAVASGSDIKSVQTLLGHATASFTLNVYAHTSEQMQRDTANRMQGYYDSLKIKA